MTPKELKTIIADSLNVNWFNNINEMLSFRWIDVNLHFTSVSALFEFVINQNDGWQVLNDAPPDIANDAKTKFQTLRVQIEFFVANSIDKNSDQLNNLWQNQVKPHLNQIITTFTYNSPELLFLSEINKNSQTQFQGAFQYITGNTGNITNKEYFNGALLAYEFLNKKGSSLSERISKENKAISKLKNEFQEYLNRIEEHLSNNLNEASSKVKTFIDETTIYKNTKEAEINNWLKNSQEANSLFSSNSDARIEELEKTYKELLRLKEPAKYWEMRAIKLKKEGRNAMYWLIALIVVSGVCLYTLLWQTPEGMLTSVFGGDKAKAIRWSIVFITFISLIFVGIRFLSKVMFSSFHLARDSEERQQLTHVYLALIKESAIDPKERELIMQSLFSRADSGLLKEDSAPTMPSGIDKFMK